MRYDIIINLDYQSHQHQEVKKLYLALQRAMLEKGFVMDGRRFTIDCEPADAQRLAREAVDAVEATYQEQGASIYPWINEFFGFAPESVSNLLLPPAEEIHVEELAGIEGLEVVDLFRPR